MKKKDIEIPKGKYKIAEIYLEFDEDGKSYIKPYFFKILEKNRILELLKATYDLIKQQPLDKINIKNYKKYRGKVKELP